MTRHICKAEQVDFESVPVRVSTRHQVNYGEIIKIVGAGPALGDWNPDVGPAMTWAEGDIWSVLLHVPPGTFDFKCVVVREDGSIAEWEPGNNRTLEIPDNEVPSTMEIVCPWSDTSATFMSFDEEDVVARLEASKQQQAGSQPSAHEDGQAQLQDTNSEPAEHVQEDAPNAAAGKTEEAQLLQSTSASDMEGQQGNEETSPTAEVVSEAGQSSPAEVATAQGVASQPEPPEEHEGSHDRNGAGLEAQVEPSEPPLSEQQQRFSTAAEQNQRGPTQTQEKLELGTTLPVPQSKAELSEPAQWTALALGYAALPLVAYSEFTLRSTGCGLPPGPYGLLGAAEGISYLVVAGLAGWALVQRITARSGLPKGPSGLLGAIEGLSYTAVLAGGAVLGLQLKEYGYIPAALPDSKCFGPGSSPSPSRNAFVGSQTAAPRIQTRALSFQGALPQQNVADSPQLGQSQPQNPSGKVQNAVQGIKDFLSSPSFAMEEVSSGVEDGLSSADLAPVVEELQGAISALVDVFAKFLGKVASPGSATNQPSGVSLGPGAYTQGSSEVQWQVFRPYPQAAPPARLQTAFQCLKQAPPLREVGMDLSLTAPATTAACAADNVVQHMNSALTTEAGESGNLAAETSAAWEALINLSQAEPEADIPDPTAIGHPEIPPADALETLESR